MAELDTLIAAGRGDLPGGDCSRSHHSWRSHGKHRDGRQRLFCRACHITRVVGECPPSKQLLRKRAVLDLLMEPGATIRGVAVLAGVSSRTVELYRGEIAHRMPPCPCGKKAGHLEWCSYRLARSPARQAFMNSPTSE